MGFELKTLDNILQIADRIKKKVFGPKSIIFCDFLNFMFRKNFFIYVCLKIEFIYIAEFV